MKIGLELDLLTKGVTPQDIDARIDEEKTHFKEKNCELLSYSVSELLAHSAQKIYLLDFSGNDTAKNLVSLMPTYLRTRVEFIGKNQKVQTQIRKSFALPLFKEIEPLWEKRRKQNSESYQHINSHEHGLCIINEFLTTLTFALKYDSEADLDINVARQAMLRLHKQVKSAENKALLSRIDGILNCYAPATSVPGLSISNQPSTEKLIEELFEDSKLLSLSKSRYLLGIPSKAQIGLIRFKRQISGYLSTSKNRNNLEKIRRVGNMGTGFFNVEIPEIEGLSDNRTFVPPLFAFSAKPPCIGTTRTLPDVIPET